MQKFRQKFISLADPDETNLRNTTYAWTRKAKQQKIPRERFYALSQRIISEKPCIITTVTVLVSPQDRPYVYYTDVIASGTVDNQW